MLLALVPTAATGDPQPLAKVTVTGDPIAPYVPLPIQGTGLCASYRALRDADLRFPPSNMSAQFPQDVNSFLDMAPSMGGPGFSPRLDRTLRTRFDLSNNITMGDTRSVGDFTMADVSCVESGCPFPVEGAMLPGIGARFRGFLNVPPDWVDKAIHFGFYADDAVALSVYDASNFKTAIGFQVVGRGPRVGISQWRVTNAVVFKKAGLFPVEVTYAQINIAAALEFALLLNNPGFPDIEEAARRDAMPPQRTLPDSQFQLVAPTLFFQSSLASHPFADVNQCQQCARAFAMADGGGSLVGCPDSYFCNQAAVCAPCREGHHCGTMCKPCVPPMPVCADDSGVRTCVQCLEDPDCELTFPAQNKKCDKRTRLCQECVVDGDCPKGKRCEDNKCVDCQQDGSCAGVSCACCPPSAPRCISSGGQFVCSECRADVDCPTGKVCDLQNRRCTDKIAECNSDDRCGASCVPCPRDQIGSSPPRPFCLEGKVCVQCRSDLDCGAGRFCLSGDCVPCTSDRRCGPSCRSCGGDTPFCKPGAAAETSACVRCLRDEDCGPGGVCDPEKNTCSTSCAMNCERDTYCDGQKCVECYADTHCPCGGSCLLSTNQCTDECKDTTDCLATQCCSKTTRKCEPGRCKPGVGVLCCEAAPGGVAEAQQDGAEGPGAPLRPAALGAAALLLAALLARRRARG